MYGPQSVVVGLQPQPLQPASEFKPPCSMPPPLPWNGAEHALSGSVVVPNVNDPAGTHIAPEVQSESAQSIWLSQSSSLPLKQSSVAGTQALTQAPPSQNGVAEPHFLPQAPQSVAVLKFVSQNSMPEVVQCPYPASHEVAGIEHLPALHCVGAPARTCGCAAQSAAELHIPSGAAPLVPSPAFALPALAVEPPTALAALAPSPALALPAAFAVEPPFALPPLLAASKPPAPLLATALLPAEALAPPALVPAVLPPNARGVPLHANVKKSAEPQTSRPCM